MPSTAAPRPPKPKARPKNSPAIRPTRPGASSWAKTTIAEKAEEKTNPMATTSAAVQNRVA